MFTDSIDSAFDKIFTDVSQGSDVVVTGKCAFDLSDGSGVADPTLPSRSSARCAGWTGSGRRREAWTATRRRDR